MMIRAICAFIALTQIGYLGIAQAQQSGPVTDSVINEYQNTLSRYCITCHNETLKTAFLELDKTDIRNVSQDPSIWERVITKLSLKQMPPVGMPRPEDSFYESFVEYLSSELDHAAELDPNPGKTMFAHRINRTEYTNVVRDLLGVEINGAEILPPDNSGGFDNLAELLSVSEVLMEDYMAAAREISRRAVGDTSIQADSHEYTINPTMLQNVRMSEDLPFGTRGGLAVRHNFPVDGEYVMNIRLLRTDDGYIIGIDEPRRVDVRVDGKRIGLLTVGGENVGLALAAGRADKLPPDFNQQQYERTADDKLEVRFPMEAGIHTVQVALLVDDFAWEGPVPPPSYDNWYASRLVGEYERAWADPGISNIMISGPYNIRGAGKTESRDRIFICTPKAKADEEPCAREIISKLARLAFRRPVNSHDNDIELLMDLYRDARSDGTFEDGIQMALEGLLVSTEFLFRMARVPGDVKEGELYEINDLELASRLSFFLWSSIPDDELLSLAEEGKLSEPDVLEQQVKRMLADERSKTLVTDFADQWLLLRNLSHMKKNQDIFNDYDESLKQAISTEINLFLSSIFQENRSVLDLFRADYTFLNERLAKHYGISGVYGNQFRRVDLPDKDLRGLLSRAAILSITTYPNRNSTVLRGKWVLENILASPPPPPPPNVPALENVKPAKPGDTMTLREKMEIHPANPTCAVCHNQFDPIGFGLENYNAIGQWRTEDEGKPINAKGRLPSGVEFEGPAELQDALLAKPEIVVGAFTQKLLTYSLGRPMEYYDMPTVREIVRTAARDDYQISSIVLGIVNSTPFKMRRAGS